MLGVFLPLAGWMWALDGILIGAEDYRYLALTCTITALAYLAALGGVNALDGAIDLGDVWRMAVLWGVLNLVFIGLRALFNGLRVRSNVWMK